ncbi:hypothetical protein OSTOST_17381 [Ostertagia ostertagi]
MLGPMPTFEDMAVGDCAPWLKTNCSSKVGGVNVGWGAIRIGLYHKHMKRNLTSLQWAWTTFQWSKFHIVDGERLVTQPALEVSQTERFLGLEPGKSYIFASSFRMGGSSHVFADLMAVSIVWGRRKAGNIRMYVQKSFNDFVVSSAPGESEILSND